MSHEELGPSLGRGRGMKESAYFKIVKVEKFLGMRQVKKESGVTFRS